MVNTWNSLPNMVVSANTTNALKTRLDKFGHNQDRSAFLDTVAEANNAHLCRHILATEYIECVIDSHVHNPDISFFKLFY